MTAARAAGALALLAAGGEHLQQYAADHYSAIPTIGTLFVLDFAVSTVVGLALLAPIRRPRAMPALLAVSGIAIAAGAIAGLLVSEQWGLFGFMESGYRSEIVASLALEAAAVVLLGGFVATLRRRHA